MINVPNKVIELTCGCKRIENYNNATIEFIMPPFVTPVVTVFRKDASINWMAIGNVKSPTANTFSYLLTEACKAAEEQVEILRAHRGLCPTCAAKDEPCNCPKE